MNSEIARQIAASALKPPFETKPPSENFFKGLTGKVWCCQFCLDEKFIAFQGHFLGNPVLPALAQVMVARETASAVSAKKMHIESIRQAKFLSLVKPGVTLSSYALPPAGESGEWRFHLTSSFEQSEEVDVSFLRVTFTDHF